MKKLIIINGITGAIGTSFFEKVIKKKDVVVYGLSRQALHFSEFLNEEDKLPPVTLISSIGDISNTKHISNFIKKINFNKFESITYIHAVGLYPFEINKKGNYFVDNDIDGDGINDDVKKLTFDSFTNFISHLVNSNIIVSGLIFGGIADKFKPRAHFSWWNTINKVKKFSKLKTVENKNLSIRLLNISSVICPHEVITRPFVFTDTDANPNYWLTPSEVSDKAISLVKSFKNGFFMEDLFHKSDYYYNDYYNDDNFGTRKRKELFKS